jgi:hypothetical protein
MARTGALLHEEAHASPSPELCDLLSNGFCVFRSAIAPDQIQSLRLDLDNYFASAGHYKYGGKCAFRGMHLLEPVANLLSSNSLLDIVSTCSHPDAAVLTGECDILVNTAGGWHKDITKDMGLGDIYEDSDFRVFKAAIYLQDQAEGSREVFKVKPGSHRCADARGVPTTSVPVQAGDVVVFDVRLDHAGQLPTLGERALHKLLGRAGSWLRKDPERLYTRVRSMLNAMRRGRVDRMGVFMTFGPAVLQTFAYERAGRKHHGPFPAELATGVNERLAARAIEIIGWNDPRGAHIG